MTVSVSQEPHQVVIEKWVVGERGLLTEGDNGLAEVGKVTWDLAKGKLQINRVGPGPVSRVEARLTEQIGLMRF